MLEYTNIHKTFQLLFVFTLIAFKQHYMLWIMSSTHIKKCWKVWQWFLQMTQWAFTTWLATFLVSCNNCAKMLHAKVAQPHSAIYRNLVANLVDALIAAIVSAFHCVASEDSDLPPNDHPRCGRPRLFHQIVAVVERECRSYSVQSFGNSLPIQTIYEFWKRTMYFILFAFYATVFSCVYLV